MNHKLSNEYERYDDYRQVFQAVLNLTCSLSISSLVSAILTAADRMDNIFIIGNGGSASTASHFSEDLSKGTRPPDSEWFPKAISLTDNTSYITALGNDEGYQNIFIGQLRPLALEPDLLIAISVSGNSSNILSAVNWANQRKLITFGLTGFTGGELASIASDCIQVPSDDFGIVESAHSFILHYIVDTLNKHWLL